MSSQIISHLQKVDLAIICPMNSYNYTGYFAIYKPDIYNKIVAN